MKIISQYKDYYDYMVGKWGMDEKLVLDRTEFTKVSDFFFGESCYMHVYSIHICGWQYDFLYNDGKFIYGEDLFNYFPDLKVKKKYSFWLSERDRKGRGVYIPSGDNRRYYSDNWMYIEKVPSTANDRLKIPILLQHYSGKYTLDRGSRHQQSFCPFPILKDLGFNKAVEAEELWLMLSQWLSKQRDIQVPETQTDKQKIVGKGFDLVESFRHRKQKSKK